MTEEAFAESVRSLRSNESCLERAGDYWSDDDKRRLEEMFDAGIGISEIAIRLQRTEPAVFQQIEKLDLYRRKARPRRRRSLKPCVCHCATCEVSQENCPRCADGEKEGLPDARAV